MERELDLAEFVEKFIEAVDFPEPVPIEANSVIRDLQYWDSLSQLGVIVMFDLEFNKKITAQNIASISTISELFELRN